LITNLFLSKKVRNIKILKEALEVRYSYTQEFENPLPIIPKTRRTKEQKKEKDSLPAPAYTEKIGISKEKKDGLISLFQKNVIPSYYFDFYSNL